MCVLFPARSKTDAHKGTAAITDQHRNGQRYHGQRKYNGIGRIAIGAQIGRIGNKDLVYHIVERRHHQRDHTGHRIPPHDPPHRLRFQKCVGLFSHNIHTSKMQKKRAVFRWIYVRIDYTLFCPIKNKRGAATGFTQLLPLVFFILLNLILFVKGNFSVVDSRIRQFFSIDGN